MYSSLCHENIIRVFELPSDIKALFASQYSEKLPLQLPTLCMEFCDNGSLRSILNRTENVCGMPENECLTILRHVTSGLEYLHQRKIIHRNLRPENIVSKLCRTPTNNIKRSKNIYKLIDMGFAKEIKKISNTGGLLEDHQYTAPELVLG